jgi:hypothetical protein
LTQNSGDEQAQAACNGNARADMYNILECDPFRRRRVMASCSRKKDGKPIERLFHPTWERFFKK